jgi:hypothetical protein
MKLDPKDQKDINLALEMMIASIVVANGGELVISHEATARVSREGITFTFDVNEKGEGVFGLKFPTEEELEMIATLKGLAEALGISVQDLINA